MSEFNKEYRIAQLLAQKMTGELSPEEEAELHEREKNSLSAIELDNRIQDPETKRQRDKFVNQLNTNSSWKKVEKHVLGKKRKSRHLTWWSSAAAVAIIITFTYILIPESQPVETPPLPVAEVKTGSSKAILITPEGKQFSLFQQDSSQTLELGNGLIAINKGNVVEYMEFSTSTYQQKNNIIQVPKGG